jgi:hypothetical protein
VTEPAPCCWVKVYCKLDPALLSAGGTGGQTVRRVHDLVDVIAPGCLLTIAAPDALLVFVQDLTRGIDVAEAIRMVVQQAFDRENVGGFEIDGAWELFVAAGASAVDRHRRRVQGRAEAWPQ